MNRREFVSAVGAATVAAGGVAVPGEAGAEEDVDLETSGGEDDTEGLEDALAAASTGDPVLVLGAGIFRLTRTVSIPNGVWLVGQGRLQTAIKWHPSFEPASGQALLKVELGGAVGLASLSLASAHVDARSGEYGLDIEEGSVEIDNCLFLDVVGTEMLADIDESIVITIG